jgi:hypothetical protein
MVEAAQSYELIWRRAKRDNAKEVEPNGHGEATRGHELYLHELAP